MFSITEFIVTVVGFLYLGRFLDSRRGSGSLFLIIGTLLGFVLGIIRLTMRLKGVMESDDKP
jgi:F0F1-type ATP synthase assembly protein I